MANLSKYFTKSEDLFYYHNYFNFLTFSEKGIIKNYLFEIAIHFHLELKWIKKIPSFSHY